MHRSVRHAATTSLRAVACLAALFALVACGDDPVDPGAQQVDNPCASVSGGTGALAIVGCGHIANRFTGEIFVRGNTAYTTTWGLRDVVRGNAINIWDVAGDVPRLVDSVVVATGATTLGDVAVSEDGRWLVVGAEPGPLSLIVYDLADPRKPVEAGRYSAGAGGHTAEIATVNGKLHAFVAVNRTGSSLSRLSIVDLSVPSQPREIYARPLTSTFIHDSFYRDGLLFLNLWDEGLQILDVGGGGKGGTLTAPVDLGRVVTAGGNVHNAWWFHDPQGNAKRYVFVGQEETGFAVPVGSAGDVHVVDITDPLQPREVAFYTVPNAGSHNFSVDEARGVLYAAYYNGGVRAIDVRGDLGTCTAAQKSADGRCDLAKMGRELAFNLQNTAVTGMMPPFIWGVHYQSNFVYASDMANGIWKLRAVQR